MRFSFKFVMFVVSVLAVLLAGFVLPETNRERVANGVSQFDNGRVWYVGADASERDPRRIFFGDQAGKSIRKIQLLLSYPVKEGQEESAVVDDEQAAAAIERIVGDWRALTHLESLTLRSKNPITEQAVVSIGRLNAVRFLSMDNAKITPAGVAALGQLENLEVLWLHNCKYSTQDFSELSRLKFLAEVKILNDENQPAALTDDGLKSFRQAVAHGYVKLEYDSQISKQKMVEFIAKRQKKREPKKSDSSE